MPAGDSPIAIVHSVNKSGFRRSPPYANSSTCISAPLSQPIPQHQPNQVANRALTLRSRLAQLINQLRLNPNH
jgi:hypothetical protein